jgi:ankyrin repeat protein
MMKRYQHLLSISTCAATSGGASPNLENKEAYTPLQLALENNQVDAVEALLKAGPGRYCGFTVRV